MEVGTAGLAVIVPKKYSPEEIYETRGFSGIGESVRRKGDGIRLP